MSELLRFVRALPEFAELSQTLGRAEARSPEEALVVSGAVGALPGLLLAGVCEETRRPILVVAPDEKSAQIIAADAAATGCGDIYVAPEPSLTPYQKVAPSLKFRKEEFALLSALAGQSLRLAIVPARFLVARMPAPDSFRSRRMAVEKGKPLPLARLLAHLASEGYTRADLVVETGDFAVRGGLVDFFAPDSARPLRIEFDGDDVVSIRSFDPDTQRSERTFERITIGPMSATPDSEEAGYLLEEKLGHAPSAAERTLFLGAIAGNRATIFDYAPEALWAVFEPAAVWQAVEQWEERLRDDFEAGETAIRPEEFAHGAHFLNGELSARTRLIFDRLGLAPGRHLAIAAEEVLAFEGKVREAAEELAREVTQGRTVTISVSPRGGVEKTRRFLSEYSLSGVEIFPAVISAGFRLRRPNMTLYAEEQVFGAERTATPVRRRAAEAFLSDLRDLKAGDFVVHVQYGVGKFRGLKRLSVEGSEREFVEIVYAQERTLLLPVERLDLVQKYAGAEGAEPRIDRLGGASWERKKSAAKKAARDLSRELVELYARRKRATGFAFSKDSPWQKEFEDAFEYTETPDQSQAIAEVKRDMEKPAPMDRLLCGDVGYGKTEVAMRAAFKAVLDGKQVALLAPTTILADQHYRTFTRRFAAFPVAIELLSRFRDARQRKKIIGQIAEGTVDIVIATHRLLSKDIRFRDLGLLIVDEEQRFGVAQKEKIKQWKTSVDILAMSATPIPRSLNLSLSGLRDLSIIETPPRDRLAIETQVVPKEGKVIREAIQFELERGGQVFYIHNRVESIGAEKIFLADLVPTTRIAVGHGQMREGELEKTMLDFVSRKYDILLATTIMENGIDIPSANTILIDRADTFGLSQLYQLRGRVGRSDKAAYCYLLIPPQAAPSETARQRLATIREFCDLGAGFRIAAKDLEIRGAGNFLGAEQSGHIAAVGFEMYLDLLEEAMREMRGEEPLPERTVTISLGETLAIPPAYLPDESQRLSLYKRIARAGDDAALDQLRQEVTDRFGPPPEPVVRLFDFARLRRRAEQLGARAVERRGARFRIVLDDSSRIEPARLLRTVSSIPGAAILPPGTVQMPDGTTVESLIEFLDRLLMPEAA